MALQAYRLTDDYFQEMVHMADITRYPFFHHLRGTATVHVR